MSKKKTPARVFCTQCQRWLEHHQYWCPLFPNVLPPPTAFITKESREKWDTCACLIHTCYKAKKVKDRRKAATYAD